ncbi:MAG: hypothetical protein U1F37_00815 [Alphaproteobacteria bacterium]
MFSFWKLLLLGLVIAGVWAGVTICKRNQRQREINEARAKQPPPNVGHIKTAACRVCGTYIPERGAQRCERRIARWWADEVVRGVGARCRPLLPQKAIPLGRGARSAPQRV